MTATNVIELPRPTPIYVLGDSHVFAFSDRVYATASAETFVFRAHHVPDILKRGLAAVGSPSEHPIVSALESIGVLVRTEQGLEAAHLTTDRHSQWICEMDDRTGVAPALVISAGSLDLLEIGVQIGAADFAVLPAILADPQTPPECAQTLPGALEAAAALAIFTARLDPLGYVVRFLRERGIDRLAVLGAGGNWASDEDYVRTMAAMGQTLAAGQQRLAFRHKLFVTMNAVLRSICDEAGVAYIDRWSETAVRGRPVPGMLRDMFHLTSDSVAATVQKLVVLFGAGDAPHGGPAHRGWLDVLAAQRFANATAADESVLAGGRNVGGARFATVHGLARATDATRVLQIGDDGGLGEVFAGDGAVLVTLEPDEVRDRARRTNRDDTTAFDVIVLYELADELSGVELERLYESAGALLRPQGRLIVALQRRYRLEERPATLFRRLRCAFEHVVTWVGDGADPLGTLAANLGYADAESAPLVFALASHAPLDREVVRQQLTASEPLGELRDEIELSEPSVPDGVAAGEPFVATVTMVNRSGARLASIGTRPVQFGYLWYDTNGLAGDGRARLALPSAPRSRRRYALRVAAPPAPGTYGLAIVLVQEHVRWFETARADVPVRVG